MERLLKYVGGPSLWVKRDDGTDLGLGQQSKGVATELKQDAARIQLGHACDRLRIRHQGLNPEWARPNLPPV
jgi:hypothetical protein